MSNIIDKIQVSGVTYDIQGSGGGGITVDPTLDSGSTNPVANSAITTALDAKVNVADNAVSTKTIMYVYDAGDTSDKYLYNNGLRINQFFVSYSKSWNTTNANAWNYVNITNNGSSTSQIILRVNASNYHITSVVSTAGDFTYTLEGGRVNVTLPDGFYIFSLGQTTNFQISHHKYTIYGGQSASALQNTYNVIQNIYNEVPKHFITGGSITCNSNYLYSYLYDNNGNGNSSMMPLGTSIKGDGNRLDVYFDGQTIHQKILNTGSGNYCGVPNNPAWNYTDDLNEIIIHFNSGYTGSNTSYTIQVNVINSSYNNYTDYLYYDVANHTLDASSATYVTATTVGDDYTYLIKPKQEYSSYKIAAIRENNWCNICGIDNQWKEEYIITGVTTPSYNYQAQEIIDDLYSKVGGGITSGEVQTMIDESISGKADTNNTVQSVGLSTLADGKSITAVIPSGNTYTATIFKVGNGLTWQAYNSTILVDTSKIAQKTDIPTVSSAITSGDTNAVAGGAVYNKIDEVEEVTAAGLNALNDAVSGKQDTLVSGTNIKTINNQSILGSGNIDIQGGGGTVESAITSGSTNAVESKAIWSATTFNKGVLLTFNGYRRSTNYPEGCGKLVVENIGSYDDSDITFRNNGGSILGRIRIENFGNISVDTSQFEGATATVDGNKVTIIYPSTGITYVEVINTSWTYTAVVEGAWVNENTYMKLEVDAIANGLQNNINSKLDATAYTPTVVDSALYAGSQNPVKNQALYSELRIDNGETETTLAFENRYSTNYPNGCTKLNVEVVGSNNHSNIEFYNDNQRLGDITIDNWGSIDVNVYFDGASYEISGTTVIITYPTVTNVTKIRVDNYGNYVFKAIVANATPLIDQVTANTTALGAVESRIAEDEEVTAAALNELNDALGGLKLVKLTQTQYNNLQTKDASTLYIILD